MTNSVQDVQHLGQSIWYDNIRRGLIKSGELQSLIDLGVTGVTSNPTIFEKAIAGSSDYDETLLELAKDGKSAQELFEAFAIEDIQATADLLRPVYDRTVGVDGYASLEVSPRLAHDTQGTISEVERLFDALDRPNVMVKVPATPEGIAAIRHLTGLGINLNVTLIFSRSAYRKVAEAYIGGLEDLAQSGGDVSKVASVASFFVSRLDTAVDALLEEKIRGGSEDLKSLLGKAAIANAKQAYRDFNEIFSGAAFKALKQKGARVQRPLWASTGTKNPGYSDVLYLESLVGPDTVNTVPPATLTAFISHGRAAVTLDQGVDEADAQMRGLAAAGISLEQVTEQLLTAGLDGFSESFEKLLANIDDKQARLLAEGHQHPGVRLGRYLADVEAGLADLQRREVIPRIWRGDHTVWKQDPVEIANRLGWLMVTDVMCEQVPDLQALARDVREAGFRHVVLLGMGGSSLGPEVLRQTFGSEAGYPELIVLDSTVPGWVQGVAGAVDPARTLFIVSSKSGSTTEPNMFYLYFRSLVEKAVGKDKAGQHFIAITDPGSSLETLAREQGFRRLFLNPADIGGRYSVLSYFGLVPAALTGMDLLKLLDRADCMREGCVSYVPAHDNPAAWLGVTMGVLAQQGRDKLTLVTSPSIGSFGLWVEQLIAESTGKEGKGIVPVAGEPLAAPDHYGADRLFVYLRLEGDDNAATDAAIEEIQASGQPVFRLDLRDKYDVGAEFYRWEMATAIAGAVLGINPFDQPNVQAAKDMTEGVLAQFESQGKLPEMSASGNLQGLLADAKPGDYLAIMAYVRQTPEVDRALASLREKVMERHGIATTMGYGPRFLHSTGQLHKGGPNSGLFLQLTADLGPDVSIPGQAFTFGVLADAQALGDMQALQAAQRRASRVHLGSDVPGGILTLVRELG
ncbi:MAG: bifunctional transaldolase/phosoglucose isomerase [Chloroflexi bacterium]|nr:bifunctional transaldolase/phosoglucose isomerase [Chloroflexota bacterium]